MKIGGSFYGRSKTDETDEVEEKKLVSIAPCMYQLLKDTCVYASFEGTCRSKRKLIGVMKGVLVRRGLHLVNNNSSADGDEGTTIIVGNGPAGLVGLHMARFIPRTHTQTGRVALQNWMVSQYRFTNNVTVPLRLRLPSSPDFPALTPTTANGQKKRNRKLGREEDEE